MEAVQIEINRNECYELAERLFFEMSGIDKEGIKYTRMKADARRMRDRVEDRICVNMICNFYDVSEMKLNGRNLNVGSESFTCIAFEQIDPGLVKGVYIYALTAGEYDFKEESIINRLYADIWGTAFTDAARILISRELNKDDYVSDNFGPGFFGMDTNEMIKVNKLLNFESIGVEFRNNKVLVPVKSCAGLFFSVSSRYKKLHNACRDCIGSERNCKLCKQREIN